MGDVHYGSVHKPIPIPEGMKIPDAKVAANKEWDKLKVYPFGIVFTSRTKVDPKHCSLSKVCKHIISGFLGMIRAIFSLHGSQND